MGMFDDVHSEFPLPDGWEGKGMQTKDFESYMNMVTIRADGRLVYDARHWQERDTKTATDMNFHGYFNFYGSEGRPGESDYKWHEYNAKFTDGALVEIVAVERAA